MPAETHLPIHLALTADEALVLFEFVSRFSDSDHLTLADPAEAAILWNLCNQLERLLAEPFSPKYAELLSTARERIRGEGPAAGAQRPGTAV
jgi:hypothetical protein